MISDRLAIGMRAGLFALSAVLCAQAGASAQESVRMEVTFRQVGPDLYFLFEFNSSNAVVLTTDEGVLVIDTRQHPRDGDDLMLDVDDPVFLHSGSGIQVCLLPVQRKTRVGDLDHE